MKLEIRSRFLTLGCQSGYQISGLITLYPKLKAHLGSLLKSLHEFQRYLLLQLDFILFCHHSYLPPEFFMHGIVDEKTDVYAYGVLLLELITGKQALDDSQKSLVMWVCYLVYARISSHINQADMLLSNCTDKEDSVKYLQAKPLIQKNSMKELVDPALGDAYDLDQLQRLALTAFMCVHQSSNHRPQMSQAC